MSIAIDPRDWVACKHLIVSHVFSSIELLDRGIKVHTWLYVKLLRIYIYVQEQNSGGLVWVCGMQGHYVDVWIKKHSSCDNMA